METEGNQCFKFLSYFVHGISGSYFYEIRNNPLKVAIMQTADQVKEKITFCYYRLAKGIYGILSYTKEGVKLWSEQNVLYTVNFVLSWLFE